MARHDFRMPDIGEGIVDAEVVAWHVAVGERIEEDAPLADVMTDKATVEITSPVAGTVVALGCAAGERITIGESLAEFETGAAADAGRAAEVEAESVPGDDAEDETSIGVAERGATAGDEAGATAAMTDAGVTDTGATRVDEPNRPAPSGEGGPSATAAVGPGGRDDAATRQGLRLNTPRREDKPHIRVLTEPADGTRRPRALASPAVRRRARELGVELSQVLGSGPEGRVLGTDLEAGARARDRAAMTASGVATATPEDARAGGAATRAAPADRAAGHAGDTLRGPTAARLPLDEDVPVIGLRRIIAERLAESSREIPHFSYVEEVDVTELEALRQHLNARRDASRPRLSLLHFVLVGLCRAVRGWPQCNAHHDDARGTLRCHSAVHLGIATMTDEGLLVPVVPNAHALDLDAMAGTVAELAAAARAKRLPRERLTGSTITVTSLGALAGIATTPIINRPETAIVGPNRMRSRLVLQDGRIVERRVMNVSASFDHRIVDGHDAASFIAELKGLLEHPATLFM